jgi:hypothetical protein
MKRLMTLLFVLAFATSVSAGGFGWSLSDSTSDPLSNTGTPVAGLVNLYLYYYCSQIAEGLASAEFDLSASMAPLSFTAENGFLNAGGATNLLLAVGGCPAGPVRAGYFLIYDAAGTGFNACLVASAANGLNVSVNCVALDTWENDYIGYANDGSTPCEDGTRCGTTAVEDTSWGAVKSLYR